MTCPSGYLSTPLLLAISRIVIVALRGSFLSTSDVVTRGLYRVTPQVKLNDATDLRHVIYNEELCSEASNTWDRLSW